LLLPIINNKKGCAGQPFLFTTFFQLDRICIYAIPQPGRCCFIVKEMTQMLSARIAQELYPFSSVGSQKIILYMISDMHPEAWEACTRIKFLVNIKQFIPAAGAFIYSLLRFFLLSYG
jgi:hypothetical protein